ncbi:MAG: hypothetical protein RL637_786 [Pseudomonadota bacterium]|jgi:maltose O-acetyltransferase
MRLYLLNLFLSFLPPTRCFKIKQLIACWAGIELASNVCINGGSRFYGNGKLIIGHNTWIGLHNHFYLTQLALIQIGSNCDIAPEVRFIPGSHQIGHSIKRAGIGIGQDIIIGNGCWIGAGSIILGGVDIGDGVIIAAGSLVNQNIPANVMVAGIPARIIKILPSLNYDS